MRISKHHDEIKILAYDLKYEHKIFRKYSEDINNARLTFFNICYKTLSQSELNLLKTDFHSFISTTTNSYVLDFYKKYQETYWNTKQIIDAIHKCHGIAILACPAYIKNINTCTENQIYAKN